MQTEAEYRAALIKIGDEEGLRNELLASFDYYLEHGDTPSQAYVCALYDWDC